MSFKRNVIANYAGQSYVALAGIVMVPLYMKYMGMEGYGLVGFYAMLQALFMLLDMGLTPTMARETARFNGETIDALSLRRLLRTLEGIFIGVAALGAVALMAGSGFIARSWLKVQQLPVEEVQHCIMLMAAIISLRWVCGLYRSAINGFERLTWLNTFDVSVATIRFVLVIPFFIYVDNSPTYFFLFQLAVAVLEVAVLVWKTYRLMPEDGRGRWVPWQWQPLRDVLKFSLTLAFTSSVWVAVTQADKLILSKLLPLSEYACFTLAVLVASGVALVSGPISGALLPRMSKLSAQDDEAGLIRLYRNATQVVAVVAIPAAMTLAFFSEPILWAWTGDATVAHDSAPVLSLYAIGNGILALSAFPYYLQFAKGDLRLHLMGNALFVLLLIPALVWATVRYGVIGAGYAWLAANAVYFMAWVPRVHRRFAKGLHGAWLMQDIGAIVLLPAIVAGAMHELVQWPHERFSAAVGAGVVGLVLFGIAAAGSSWVREAMRCRWIARSAG